MALPKNPTQLDVIKAVNDIPTNTSQLNNDAGFVTPSYHDSTKQDKIIIDADLATITPVENTYYRHQGTGGGGAVATPFVLGQTYDKIYFDTSKSVEEMTEILSGLELEEGFMFPILGFTTISEDAVGVMIYDLAVAGLAESGYAFFSPTMDTCFFSTVEIQTPSGTTTAIGWQNLDADGSYTFDEFIVETVNNVSFLSSAPFESQFIDGVIYLYSDGGFQAVGRTIRWGDISGTLSNQTDLQNALNAKQNAITSANKLDYSLIGGTPTIPSKTSDLTNDSNFVSDANYVHTDNNYTNTDKSKISGLPTFTYDASTYTLTITP